MKPIHIEQRREPFWGTPIEEAIEILERSSKIVDLEKFKENRG